MPAGAGRRKPPRDREEVPGRRPAGQEVPDAARPATTPRRPPAAESTPNQKLASATRELLDPVEIEGQPVVERADRERDQHADRADHDEGRRAEQAADPPLEKLSAGRLASTAGRLSWPPRGGSPRRQARNASATLGRPTSRNAARQP